MYENISIPNISKTKMVYYFSTRCVCAPTDFLISYIKNVLEL